MNHFKTTGYKVLFVSTISHVKSAGLTIAFSVCLSLHVSPPNHPQDTRVANRCRLPFRKRCSHSFRLSCQSRHSQQAGLNQRLQSRKLVTGELEGMKNQEKHLSGRLMNHKEKDGRATYPLI